MTAKVGRRMTSLWAAHLGRSPAEPVRALCGTVRACRTPSSWPGPARSAVPRRAGSSITAGPSTSPAATPPPARRLRRGRGRVQPARPHRPGCGRPVVAGGRRGRRPARRLCVFHGGRRDDACSRWPAGSASTVMISSKAVYVDAAGNHVQLRAPAPVRRARARDSTHPGARLRRPRQPRGVRAEQGGRRAGAALDSGLPCHRAAALEGARRRRAEPARVGLRATCSSPVGGTLLPRPPRRRRSTPRPRSATRPR